MRFARDVSLGKPKPVLVIMNRIMRIQGHKQRRRLGLSICMGLVMALLMACSARGDLLTSESYPVTLTGNQESFIEFTFTTGRAACNKAGFSASISGATNTVTLKPSFSECTAFGFPALIDVNGCAFVVSVELGPSTFGQANLECPSEKSITVTAIAAGTAKCTVHVQPAVNVGSMSFANVGWGSTREVRMSFFVTSLPYSHTKGTGLGSCTAGSGGFTGKFNGSVYFTGESFPGSHSGVFLSNW
jgi:hypothetical protein